MQITRTSVLTGITHTMELDVTPEQICRHNAGELAQVAFSNLSAEEREFLISGITPEEWAKYCPEEEQHHQGQQAFELKQEQLLDNMPKQGKLIH